MNISVPNQNDRSWSQVGVFLIDSEDTGVNFSPDK